ncbi:hypothetical protein HC891_10455 [Candidatus Gracilibacteria bacterium]|nr:hypothetical protein [Candidatus Gracilibacteria bacterium]
MATGPTDSSDGNFKSKQRYVADLVARVGALREGYAACADTQQREGLLAELTQVHMALWKEVHRPLCAIIARNWTRSVLFGQLTTEHRPGTPFFEIVESLAFNVFGDMLDILPTLKLDPERNGVALLLTIAVRQLSANDKKLRKDLHESLNGDVERDERTAHEEIDAQQLELFEQTAARIAQQECVQAALAYWHETLDEIDWLLVRARLLTDPQLPFAAIVKMLRPGYNEAALRQRLSRICKRTEEYLRGNGWEALF